MRSADLIKSHTPERAAQEIAALILAYAILVEQRIEVAKAGGVEVLRISFLKTHQMLSGLWQFLALADGMISEAQVQKLIKITINEIAATAIPKRRKRSSPRAVRQPVSSWPRLLKYTTKEGPIEVEITPVTT